MPPEQTIAFAPELDERQLDREVSGVNKQLESVGEDVPVSFDAEELDSLSPAGVGGGGGGGGVGGGAAGAGGAAAMASKIPKPVAGVTAAAALPVALAGGVGTAMLSAMTGASARLQTSNAIMGQAWNNVWRPIGDKVDQLFVRPIAADLLSETQNFEEALRNGDWFEAGSQLSLGISTTDIFSSEGIGSIFGGLGGAWAGAKGGAAVGGTLGSIIPGLGTGIGAGVGGVLGGGLGLLAGSRIGGGLGKDLENIDVSGLKTAVNGIQPALSNAASDLQSDLTTAGENLISDFNGIDWGQAITDLQNVFTGGIDLGQWMFSGAIDFGQWMFHGAIDIGQWAFTGAIDIGQDLLDSASKLQWSDIKWAGSIGWDAITWAGSVYWDAISWAGNIGWDAITWAGSIGWDAIEWTGSINASNIVSGSIDIGEYVVGGIGSTLDGLQSGGRVRSTGAAVVHKGEMVGSPEKLVDELASAINDNTGGGGAAQVDTSGVESKLDRLHRDLRRLESALDVTLEVGSEEIGRAAAEGKREMLSDTDPLV